jgi:hypothetical protein
MGIFALARKRYVLVRIKQNQGDMTWEQMLPELGEDSPRFSILRVDPPGQNDLGKGAPGL